MLRHSVFAVVLVGAAFAGGAVMNGTGLAWFKALAAGGPRIVVDSAAPGAGAQASAPATPAPPNGPPPPPFPSASPPALDLGLALTPSTEGAAPTTPTARPAAPTLPGSDPVATAPAPDLAATPPSLDPATIPDLSVSPTPPPIPKTDPVARQASGESPGPSPGPAHDWADLRRRLRAAGVARYEIAAEVEGRVRFQCVVPVEGLRAVGHQFEAEGDDEFQAADAALRRITLWRATETR